ncbi:type II CAAX endopeptidase family protein [Stigmatella sp. ncwal1]|uniref:Type II CAAX endopeptidase family protein n=1 Tax=Stigmatella ashevillensis TaxID=2995309 RepID=A0ABT5D0X8_9BACT|nr:type II CAAX endopeptidase family protein [Stigmatella ashevillena]MDC0707321.1 type II CAAX endopeptidase family protein [Stigmatella ashevillena]
MSFSRIEEEFPVDDSTPQADPPAASLSPLALAIIGLGLVLSLFLTLGAASQLLNAAFGLWFSEIFVFVGVAWVLLRAARYEPVSYTGIRPQGFASAAFGFALGVANFFALVVPIQYAAQSLAPEWLREMFNGSRIFEGQSPVELALLLAGVSIAAPVCEEFFFRGLVQKGLLSSSLSRAGAVGVTAVVFSAFHLDPVGFLARVELGVLFGVLRLYTGSLWPGILAHSANNVVSSALFLIARQFDTGASDERPPVQGVLILMGLGLMALWGLIVLASKHPSLWGTRREPPAGTAVERSLFRWILPWGLGATLCLGLLALVDMPGIRLNLLDMRQPLPRLKKDAPDALHAERASLMQLRAQVRRGRVPLQVYEEERARQAFQHRSQEP